VHRQPLPVPRTILVYDLRPPAQQLLDGTDVAPLDGIVQPGSGHTVHASFELRPTVETIRASEHQLRIVQSEAAAIGVAVVRPHLRHRVVSPAENPSSSSLAWRLS
jgi:hypothetical protein